MKEKQGQTEKITEVKKTEEEKDFKGSGVEGTKAENKDPKIEELEKLLSEKDVRIAELEKKVSELSPKTVTNVVKGEDVIKALRAKGVKI